jgi:hypothetical protein
LGNNRFVARNLILLVAILAAGVARATTLESQSPCSDSQAEFDTALRLAHDDDWQAVNAWRDAGHVFLVAATKIIDLGEIPGDIGIHRVRVFGTFQILYCSEGSIIDDNTTTPTASDSVAGPTPAGSVPTNVVSAITSNRWSGDALIVTGTLTNTSTIAVLITGIDSLGFDQDQKIVDRSSDFAILHNDLAPGEVVNFKIALKDGGKQIKFVKVLPSWSP